MSLTKCGFISLYKIRDEIRSVEHDEHQINCGHETRRVHPAGDGISAGSLRPVSQTVDKAEKESSAYIQNKGSDTMVNLALLWARSLPEGKPGWCAFLLPAADPAQEITALMTNTVDIANASRAIKPEELPKQETGL
jgi:ABC-type phosphate transport system substrate-binding protein